MAAEGSDLFFFSVLSEQCGLAVLSVSLFLCVVVFGYLDLEVLFLLLGAMIIQEFLERGKQRARPQREETLRERPERGRQRLIQVQRNQRKRAQIAQIRNGRAIQRSL